MKDIIIEKKDLWIVETLKNKGYNVKIISNADGSQYWIRWKEEAE